MLSPATGLALLTACIEFLRKTASFLVILMLLWACLLSPTGLFCAVENAKCCIFNSSFALFRLNSIFLAIFPVVLRLFASFSAP